MQELWSEHLPKELILWPQYSSTERWGMGEEVDHRDTVLTSGLNSFSQKFIPPLEKLGLSWERWLLKERLSFHFASRYTPLPS